MKIKQTVDFGAISNLQELLDNSFDSVVVTTKGGASEGYRIVYVNEAFSRMTGYHPGEVIGKTPGILQGPDTNQAEINRLDDCIKQGLSFHGSAVNYRKDGSKFMMEWKVLPIKDENDEAAYYLALQRDLTTAPELNESCCMVGRA